MFSKLGMYQLLILPSRIRKVWNSFCQDFHDCLVRACIFNLANQRSRRCFLIIMLTAAFKELSSDTEGRVR